MAVSNAMLVVPMLVAPAQAALGCTWASNICTCAGKDLQCGSSWPLSCCNVAVSTTTIHTTALQCDAPSPRGTHPQRMVCGAMCLPGSGRGPHTTSLCRTSQRVRHATLCLGSNCMPGQRMRIRSHIPLWLGSLCFAGGRQQDLQSCIPLWLGCWCCVGCVPECLKLALYMVTHMGLRGARATKSAAEQGTCSPRDLLSRGTSSSLVVSASRARLPSTCFQSCNARVSRPVHGISLCSLVPSTGQRRVIPLDILAVSPPQYPWRHRPPRCSATGQRWGVYSDSCRMLRLMPVIYSAPGSCSRGVRLLLVSDHWLLCNGNVTAAAPAPQLHPKASG